ncbi:NAD+ synthase [Halobacillus karajensis]|uniref:NH(3)-dependent NAD(+) synthetase n=1 Tax=Halobacillus karajensis TaxID=195088 RepID=A0A024P6G6_9BACI|nr:NAD(+) synthase [Halobacillus karajensis]CDQ18124.1 NH(3)-dependent NAD(+) synthetase [Halobacillus karajensis]CDQ24475.1 NH(3)-dependent NAD(+) synthetase [Halobacillus karajensis]CDQ29277.1 NH(3)-dependent NAD(+) synthetase [Halobacillus karajensis]SEH58793.1 NAD+ synthase [Halobacillus karajensis]
MEQKVEKLVTWLQEQVKQANVEGLLVGVSGGIDSAVVANLIKRACPENSLGVIMPCKSQSEDQSHAKSVVEACDLPVTTVDLTKTHEVMFATIKQQLKEAGTFDEEQEKLADANLRARLRMSTLYTIATNHQYLVVGTDNAAEWYTGYFTKFGDGGVDLVPLVNLTKGEVREMAEYLDVPDEVIHKQPSAGLWEGQTDENEMGTSYAMIDRHLKGEEIPEEDRRIIESLHQRSAHKRQLPPAPPK